MLRLPYVYFLYLSVFELYKWFFYTKIPGRPSVCVCEVTFVGQTSEATKWLGEGPLSPDGPRIRCS